MPKGDYLNTILRSDKTVFSLKDIALLWQETDAKIAKARLNYYLQKGGLHHIRRGFYAKNKDYNRLEFATRVYTPSYISFETGLASEGVIFQYHTTITVASYLTRVIVADNQTYSYKKIKDTILIDPTGVQQIDNVAIATKERAFLDTLYSNPHYHFDNLRFLNWDQVFTILPIYSNQRMTQAVNRLFHQEKN